MGGVALESSKQEKDLGVLIEDNLKPKAQCGKAASKANMILGQLMRGCTWRDPENLTKLYKVYKVYVRPHPMAARRHQHTGAGPAQIHQDGVRDGEPEL